MSNNHSLRTLAGAVLLCLLSSAHAFGQAPFIRGDVNCDGVIDTFDVAMIRDFVFLGIPLQCYDPADLNDNGTVTSADLAYLVNFVSTGAPVPMPPYPNCGFDPTPDGLICQSSCCGSPRDHFQVWKLAPQTFLMNVTVQDQFMFDQLTLTSIDYLCNPAKKDTFLIDRPDDHLTWYRARGRDTLLTVEFLNQFGLDTVDIDSVSYLVLPTQKFPHPPPSPELDHYKAYHIRNPQPFVRVTQISDEFIPAFTVDQLIPRYFLTPVSKNGEVIRDTVTHYVAYETIPKATLASIRTTQDQFGPHTLQVINSEMLLVPTYKLSYHPPQVNDTLKNHYKTWRINPPAPFSGLAVVQDQFQTQDLFLSDIEFLSNPAHKDTSDIRRPNDHLNWYKVLGAHPTLLQVEYENQFLKDTILIDSTTHLLVPCRKDPHPKPDSLLGHYTAYHIRNGAKYIKPGTQVRAQDQFDQVPEVFDSLVARYFLTPAKKNNEPQYGSDTHYVAYEIYPKTFGANLVPRLTEDQFGQHLLPIYQSELLLVPTHKISWGPPPGDTVKNHYKGWKLDPLPFPITAQVRDQFMSDVLKLDSIRYLANPTTKNNEPIILPDDHLLWYSADGRDTCLQVIFNNQFGLDTLVVGTVSYLILPAQKLPHNPPSTTLDHYKAYQVWRPQDFIRVNTLMDQFDATPFTVDRLKPLYLCLPCSKNGEPIHDSVTHYMAYEFTPKQNLQVGRTVIDQFGTHQVRTTRSELLMVPTKKLQVKPFCPILVPGDANCDGIVTAADIIGMVNYVFKSGASPCPCPAAGDINCSGTVTSADVIALVNYVFKNGLPPCNPCNIIPALWKCPC